MSRRDKVLCTIYGLIALAALIATWTQNLAFMRQPDHGWLAGFLRGGYANPAAASLTNDLLFFALAGAIFMVVEARRVGVRFVWAYLVVAFCVAISVAFPLFLIARQRALAERNSGYTSPP
jgi:hypothetical protein